MPPSHLRPDGRSPFAGPVIGTFVGVPPPHTLWDSTHGIALWLAARPASTRPDRELFTKALLHVARMRAPTRRAFLDKYPLGV